MKTKMLARLAAAGLLAGWVGSAGAQPAVSAWPLFHRDVHRTGRSTVAGPALPTNARQVWKGFGALRSSPVIGPDGTVYQGSGKKWCAIDPMVGIPIPQKWCTEMTGTVVLAQPGLGIDPTNPALTQAQMGVLNHFALGVPNMQAAYTKLWNDDRLQGQVDRGQQTVPKIGRDAKWQLNLIDPDGTRAEVMELRAIGKPCCSPFTAADPEK